jgi:hypothetical protein
MRFLIGIDGGHAERLLSEWHEEHVNLLGHVRVKCPKE